MVHDGGHVVAAEAPRTGRSTLRHVATVLSLMVGAVYLILLLEVASAEAGSAQDTYGVYLVLAAVYLFGGYLLATRDERSVFAGGVVVQALVLTAFVVYGTGVRGPGVLDDAAAGGGHIELWATSVGIAQVALLGLLAYLAVTAHGTGRSPYST